MLQDRLFKVAFFVSSLLDKLKEPILILADSSALSLWETEFSKWSKLIRVLTYKGNKDVRADIRASELFSQNGSVMCQVLLSSPDDLVEVHNCLNMKLIYTIWICFIKLNS